MLEQFTVINLPAGYTPHPSSPLLKDEQAFFVLKTCLRTLILDLKYPSFRPSSNHFSAFSQEVFFDEEAYIYTLEILCGLRSKILAENEVISQFKEAYKQYLQLPNRNPYLIKILEKLIQDTKNVRTQFLIGISQKSYASIARKLVLNAQCSVVSSAAKVNNVNKVNKVLLLGSGALTVDLIHQFQKWTPVYVSARNSEKVGELASKYQLQTIPWLDHEQYFDFQYIICSIGTEHVLFDQNFFKEWHHYSSPSLSSSQNQRKLFIDFGSPSPIETPLTSQHGVYRLKDIFHQESIDFEQKMDQIKKAFAAIRSLVHKRKKIISFQAASLQRQAVASVASN